MTGCVNLVCMYVCRYGLINLSDWSLTSHSLNQRLGFSFCLHWHPQITRAHTQLCREEWQFVLDWRNVRIFILMCPVQHSYTWGFFWLGLSGRRQDCGIYIPVVFHTPRAKGTTTGSPLTILITSTYLSTSVVDLFLTTVSLVSVLSRFHSELPLQSLLSTWPGHFPADAKRV